MMFRKWLMLVVMALMLAFPASAEESVREGVDGWSTNAMTMTVRDGMFQMIRHDVRGDEPLIAFPVKEGFAEALGNCEEEMLPTPEYFRAPFCQMLDDSMTGGREVVGAVVQRDYLIMILRQEDGTHRLRMAMALPNGGYCFSETGALPEEPSLDGYHAGNGTIYLNCTLEGKRSMLSFWAAGDGSWYLTGVMCEGAYDVRWNSLGDREKGLPQRNDGYRYGSHPWMEKVTAELDLAGIPPHFEDAVKQVDSTGWAVVNNPDPADRLYLRAEPNRGAASLGKFYNRTPVEVIQRGETWSRVRIGRGLEGYMMTEYLAFDAEMDSVACAFPQLMLQENITELDVLDAPEKQGGNRQFLADGRDEFIIGVYGEDWLIIMDEITGDVGYANAAAYWEGNG